ncbi:MAG: type I phosphomannose isomerase catalytic subunit [Bilifractor sp.]|jgi:mannose-6-phosphate isomerase class I
MTSISMTSTAEPFRLSPTGKDYIWGGTKLKEDYSKDIDLDPLAETWECSTHPDGISTVADGPMKGMLLTDVLKEHPEYVGSHAQKNQLHEGEIPILVKLIDAKRDLSVQVHPDDEYARIHENGSRGKTEMWYVLDAKKGATLVYGFSTDMTKERVRRSLAEGTIEKYLHKVDVHADDLFMIHSGTVHAIGSGILLAEIQESSNLTYRLYDYGRLGKDGKPRELHVDKALDVANLKSSDDPRQPMRVLCYRKGYASELLMRCKYFQVERVLINTERCREMTGMRTDNTSFQVLLCTNGCGVLMDDKTTIDFIKGDCIFIPANSPYLRLHGCAQLLKIRC